MVEVVFFREADGRVPLLEWFDELPAEAVPRCIAKLQLLAWFGHQLRRPHTDLLRDGIHELRVKSRGLNLRLLYFFDGQRAVVVSHGITKQQAQVPTTEIELARHRMLAFRDDPRRHTYREGRS